MKSLLPPHPRTDDKRGFTLIELLVVIAIIAILAVVVVLVLNPAELLKQSRDANRLSDITTLNNAIGFYQTDQSGAQTFSLGNASTVYMSVPDFTATTTAGTNCGSMGLSRPRSDTWHCAASSTSRSINTSGWIPINFSDISSGAPFGSLPVDPVNTTSSNLYYTYTTNGFQYEITANMESAKYQNGGTGDVESTDGGQYPNLYEKGTNLTLAPIDFAGSVTAGCAYQRAITINDAEVSSTDETDFPMLFSGTYSYLATVANGGDVQNANGDDIIFTSDAAGDDVLPFEQESYNASTGAVNYWIQIPTLSNSTDTVIYLWYDNPKIKTSQADPTGVWSNGYLLVAHLFNTSNLVNSVTGLPMTNHSATNGSGGVGGGGVSFNGSSAYIDTGVSLASAALPLTVDVWFDHASGGGNPSGMVGNYTSNNGLVGPQLYSGSPRTFIFSSGQYTYQWSAVGLSDSTWYQAETVIASATTMTQYLDGGLAPSGPNGENATGLGSSAQNVYIGVDDVAGGEWWSGTLSEVRLSSVVRSAAWIATEYNNESSPSAFYSVGAATTL